MKSWLSWKIHKMEISTSSTSTPNFGIEKDHSLSLVKICVHWQFCSGFRFRFETHLASYTSDEQAKLRNWSRNTCKGINLLLDGCFARVKIFSLRIGRTWKPSFPQKYTARIKLAPKGTNAPSWNSRFFVQVAAWRFSETNSLQVM